MTTATASTIALATSADHRNVIEILVAAFVRDPVVRWMYPDEGAYRSAFPAIIDGLGGRAFASGGVYLTSDHRGAALWLPPGIEPDDSAITSIVQRSLAGETRRTTFALFEQMGQAHPQEPHWYLPFLGVIPDFQGEGIGRALLEASLVQCDAAGLPAYLESTNPRNVPLYRRHGFEVSGDIRAGDCPPLIPMIRPRRG